MWSLPLDGRLPRPTGGAVVFFLLTGGHRHAFLPLLYDEAGAAIREANLGVIAAP